MIKDDAIYGEDAFHAFLDEPFVTGTVAGEYSLAGVDWDGGELTRREAWERALKANFDFARTRLSYIYNQVYYTYVGAWEAHEGLRIIGSDYYEGRERSQRILLESLGIRPFLGEEVLVGPNGEELIYTIRCSITMEARSSPTTSSILSARGLPRASWTPMATWSDDCPTARIIPV